LAGGTEAEVTGSFLTEDVRCRKQQQKNRKSVEGSREHRSTFAHKYYSRDNIGREPPEFINCVLKPASEPRHDSGGESQVVFVSRETLEQAYAISASEKFIQIEAGAVPIQLRGAN